MSNIIEFDNCPDDTLSYNWADRKRVTQDRYEYERWKLKTLLELVPSKAELAIRLGITPTSLHKRINRYNLREEL